MDGYVWWYVDAISDDGKEALTVIAFIGSVFSPYYALARSRGRGDPFNHCAINVALYSSSGKRWAMTERTRHDIDRSAARLSIGPSALTWNGTTLEIAVDERTVPIPARLKGRILLTPEVTTARMTHLDAAGRHSWLPLSPSARIGIDFDKPATRWTGRGYFDCNWGSEPLERAFRRWDWSRAHTDDGTIVLYVGERRDGTPFAISRRIGHDGVIADVAVPPIVALPMTKWRVERRTCCDHGARPRVLETLEDTPFYARSLVETTIHGKRMVAVHESLSLDRVANPVVRAMLPFRMPRRRYRRNEAK